MDSGKLAFTVDELATATGLCRDTIYEEIRAERLRAKKLGKRTLVLQSDAHAFLEALPDLKLLPTDEGGVVAQIADARKRRATK